MKLRDDLERLKKIRNYRGLRHYWGLRVRGQHTKTTGRGENCWCVKKAMIMSYSYGLLSFLHFYLFVTVISSH
ncbi:hypothetical protein GIB67_039132 [Kingdonia uniflora]|uniref:40S ribosomal protein S18 n=1 Tax=Kingdonia uniflora TaxID=39325 RepID=A0A7J7MLP9_9MAGN|nr:hypothetical protein GIB67_039132 [Kingdonia uniflora]